MQQTYRKKSSESSSFEDILNWTKIHNDDMFSVKSSGIGFSEKHLLEYFSYFVHIVYISELNCSKLNLGNPFNLDAIYLKVHWHSFQKFRSSASSTTWASTESSHETIDSVTFTWKAVHDISIYVFILSVWAQFKFSIPLDRNSPISAPTTAQP